jgi:hypothetical protein
VNTGARALDQPEELARMNRTALPSVLSSTALPCPPFCVWHVASPAGDDYLNHSADSVDVNYVDPERVAGPVTLRIKLVRFDAHGVPGPVLVTLGRVDQAGMLVEIDPNTALSVDAAERLGWALLNVVAQARAAELPVCDRCGHGFLRDSSPHDDHCWACAEIIDAEAGAR